MKKTLVLLFTLGLSHSLFSQSTQYQQSQTRLLDDNFELFQKHLFSASKYEFEELKDVSGMEKVYVDFYHVVSALKIENPGSSDLLYDFIRNHSGHSKVNDAAHILGDFFFEKRNYREAIQAYQKVNLDQIWPEQRAEVQFKSGYAYFQVKDNRNALIFFNQVKSQPNVYKADAHYYAGFIAMEGGNNEQAIKDFREAEKSNFYAGKVPYMLAGIYYRQGQYDELVAYSEPVLANRKNLDRKEEIHLFLAEAYFEKRDFAKAALNYDAFVNSRKGDLTKAQIYKAGVSQFEIKNFQRATDYFKVTAVDNDQIGQVSSYYLGHAYLKMGNTQFASTSFQAAYKSDVDAGIKEEALFNYAKVNLEKGSFQDAVNALDTYLDNYPRGSYARDAENLLTDALINTSNYLRAIEQIEKMPRKSERINSAYQKITFFQGIVYYRDKRFDLATNYFNKSLNTPVDKDLVIETHFWKAENSAAKGDIPAAIRSYEALQNARPGAGNSFLLKSYYGLGYAFFNTEQYAKAEVQFRNYVDRLQARPDRENYDEAIIRLGDTYYVQKKFNEAQATFQRAISENIRYIDYAYFRSGVVFNFQNRNDEAIRQLNQLINNYPNSLYLEDALYQKSQINMEQTRYAEANEGFTRLIDSKPNSPFIPFALEGRAVANFSLQNYNATIEDYKRILQNHPNSSNAESALVGLQEALALQGRSGEFSQLSARYRSANPDNKSLQNLDFEAAKSLFFNSSWDQAIRALDEYLKNYPQASNRAEAIFFKGDAEYRSGKKDQALVSFYQIEKERESPQRLRAVQRIAQIESENKNYSKAIPFHREAARNARNKIEELEAFNGLMVAHFHTNRFDSAVVYADRIINLGSVTPDAIPEALLMKGKAYFKAANPKAAEDVLMDLINEYKTVHGAEGLYLLAESYHSRGNFSQSNDAIFDFSGPFSVHAYWYGRSFVLLADNYIKMGENFQAKATLESIVEGTSDAEIKRMATERLSQIK
jgi:tetratricopeptide (TPR) repeat protein